jgi:hypothetical protein
MEKERFSEAAEPWITTGKSIYLSYFQPSEDMRHRSRGSG